MRVQAFIELDTQMRTEIQEEAFNQFCSSYLLNYHKMHTTDVREYYHCIIVDAANIPTMLTIMAARNPIVNGCWNIDGEPYLDGFGNPTYPFDLPLHLVHTENEKYFDPELNEWVITESSNTFTPLHGYAGWALPTEY